MRCVRVDGGEQRVNYLCCISMYFVGAVSSVPHGHTPRTKEQWRKTHNNSSEQATASQQIYTQFSMVYYKFITRSVNEPNESTKLLVNINCLHDARALVRVWVCVHWHIFQCICFPFWTISAAVAVAAVPSAIVIRPRTNDKHEKQYRCIVRFTAVRYLQFGSLRAQFCHRHLANLCEITVI